MSESLSNNRTVPSFFRKEFLLETFGREDPSVHERSKKFFAIWCEWRDHELDVYSVEEIQAGLKRIGIAEYEDYIFSQGRHKIRFKHKEDMAQIILTCDTVIRHNA